MKTKNLPKEVMQQLAQKALALKCLDMRGHYDKPGELIQSLGPVKRQILKDLTSGDIKDVRWLK